MPGNGHSSKTGNEHRDHRECRDFQQELYSRGQAQAQQFGNAPEIHAFGSLPKPYRPPAVMVKKNGRKKYNHVEARGKGRPATSGHAKGPKSKMPIDEHPIPKKVH